MFSLLSLGRSRFSGRFSFLCSFGESDWGGHRIGPGAGILHPLQ
jgi:hypothetical protein